MKQTILLGCLIIIAGLFIGMFIDSRKNIGTEFKTTFESTRKTRVEKPKEVEKFEERREEIINTVKKFTDNAKEKIAKLSEDLNDEEKKEEIVDKARKFADNAKKKVEKLAEDKK